MMDFDDLEDKDLDEFGRSKFAANRPRKEYPHPHIVCGAGQGGLRQALEFLQNGQENFVVIDRRSRLGGTSWLQQANPTTKVQTEFGTFHLNWSEKCAVPKGYSVWPSRDELLKHYEEVVDQEGIRPYLRLNTELVKMDIVPDPLNPEEQHYDFLMKDTVTGKEERFKGASFTYFPGNLTNPRRETYPGEDVFDGIIEYAICSQVDYSKVTKQNVAIVGFGAFAVENIRTCVEFKAQKIFLVCRRKNLCMPRMISWEINSSIWPVPAAMVMRHMQKAYDMIGDDHWSFYAVQSSKDRSNVTIHQKARFGIGDVYFLARYFGVCEVIVDSVKRLSKHTVHLESGRNLENVTSILKLFGFVGEWAVDKLVRLNEMKGLWVDGDCRRPLFSEPPEVNAQRFSGTSFSPAANTICCWFRHFLDYPDDFKTMMNAAGKMMPVHKPDVEKNIPGYVSDARLNSTMMMVIGSLLPEDLQKFEARNPALKRQKQWETHSMKEVVEEATAEWKKYCEFFKELGYTKPAPDYLYSIEEVEGMIKEQDEAGVQAMQAMAAKAH